jgi:MFS family permease
MTAPAPQHARTPAWRRALAAPPGGRRAAFRAWRHSSRAAFRTWRAAFRTWRHGRPFSGGLLLIIAGIELLVIPLSGLLLKGALRLVIYVGIGGVFGTLIGVLLIAAGIMMWVNPAHRVFYGIAGIVLGILSFPASNLGGFLIAMLLGIIGGALGFAWAQVDEPAGPRSWRLRVRSRTRGHRVFAVAAMPALLVAGMLSTSAHASQPAPQPGNGCILWIICLPDPFLPPSPQPLPPSLQPLPPSLQPLPPGPSPSARQPAPAKQVADPGLTAPCATSVLNAGSATLTNFAFKGIVDMATRCGGGTQTMMEFTASSSTLASGVTVTVTQNGQHMVTASPTLGFSGGMTLYATKLCGTLAGIPLCFTPSTVSAVLLRIANLLTSALPITMTNVATDQPLALAGGLQTGPLSIGF